MLILNEYIRTCLLRSLMIYSLSNPHGLKKIMVPRSMVELDLKDIIGNNGGCGNYNLKQLLRTFDDQFVHALSSFVQMYEVKVNGFRRRYYCSLMFLFYCQIMTFIAQTLCCLLIFLFYFRILTFYSRDVVLSFFKIFMLHLQFFLKKSSFFFKKKLH